MNVVFVQRKVNGKKKTKGQEKNVQVVVLNGKDSSKLRTRWPDIFRFVGGCLPAAQNTLKKKSKKKKDRKHRFTFLALITPPALRQKNTLTTRKSKTTINGEYQKSICKTKEHKLLSDPEGFQKVESSFSRLRTRLFTFGGQRTYGRSLAYE
ncbi:hypothetical protein TNCV_25701 [Trichonephila clavipes]|uniref:Uncharacterized protein n=1 Tax=Trichonephila clavipes TaxID=2585209 RepID=A0A8X7BC99_TRICX|nr:hypothetical protein TNCV_25701 [Trichonephila clavipes]